MSNEQQAPSKAERRRQGARATGWALLLLGLVGAWTGWNARNGLETTPGVFVHPGLIPFSVGLAMIVAGLVLVAWSFRRR